MEQVEAQNTAYFHGRISIHQLMEMVPIKMVDQDGAIKWRYPIIVKRFWEHIVRQMELLGKTADPNEVMTPNDFLQTMIHYIRIKSEYGEAQGQLF
jgi:hypothetical protein